VGGTAARFILRLHEECDLKQYLICNGLTLLRIFVTLVLDKSLATTFCTNPGYSISDTHLAYLQQSVGCTGATYAPGAPELLSIFSAVPCLSKSCATSLLFLGQC